MALISGIIISLAIIFFVIIFINGLDQQSAIVDDKSNNWRDFELSTSSGEMWSSKSIAAQPTVINFWAPWCLPCRKEIPYLIDLQERYGSKFQFIGIAIDQASAVYKFENEVGLNYLSLVDDTKGMALLKHYEPSTMLPVTLIFDRNRQLKYRFLGSFKPRELEQILINIIQENS